MVVVASAVAASAAAAAVEDIPAEDSAEAHPAEAELPDVGDCEWDLLCGIRKLTLLAGKNFWGNESSSLPGLGMFAVREKQKSS